MTSDLKVALVKHSSYSSGVEEAIETLLSNLGGIEAYIKPGDHVLIKPNMLSSKKPSEAVTTHPEIVRAIIRILKKHNTVISVADSPCSANRIPAVWEATGFKTLCKEESVELVNLEKAGSQTFSQGEHSFNIALPVLEADLVINVPKVKTHILTTLTAAIKNLYGTIPGYQKASLHKKHPTPAAFGRLINEIYKHSPRMLHIADGIIGMDGNGPSAGKPAALSLIAASDNAAALDIVLCKILSLDPKAVPYLKDYLEITDNIKTVGATISEVTPDSFAAPNTMPARLIPESIVKILSPFVWFRPRIEDSCVACAMCVKACPADALSIDQDLLKAVLEPKKCIECCCCHEICPEKAITMTQSPFMNFVRKGKMP